MTQLYKLTGQLKELEILVSKEEVPAEQVEDTLKVIEGDFEEKAINIIKVVKNQQPSIDAMDNEIARLNRMKKSIASKMENLKEYLRTNMEASGISKIECPLFTITCKKPADVVIITDEDELPDDLVTTKTTVSPDKKVILKKLKAGEDVPGAHLGKAKAALQIK